MVQAHSGDRCGRVDGDDNLLADVFIGAKKRDSLGSFADSMNSEL